jgi:hypothetical protein
MREIGCIQLATTYDLQGYRGVRTSYSKDVVSHGGLIVMVSAYMSFVRAIY